MSTAKGRERRWRHFSTLPDEFQLSVAAREHRVFFTHDTRDFSRLASDWAIAGRTHAGFSWHINFLYVTLFFDAGRFSFAAHPWPIPIRFFGFLLSFKRNNFFVPGLPSTALESSPVLRVWPWVLESIRIVL